ncbi:tetratricopeptide repeat protein (macronuclear) [Tetrahymena thermophila SB210]|uniref:Tetratricopeptide repeat protein n=1 Tax=Tetrahymena thermophila (strain SB210) TaxID=312017 RepID=Q245R2_TETTS|nr:tetratricopeptide repeat protein [Tetrahymena thermophila SB210]EAS03571.2 tetratricopeptide repeat protein [Tetrahymena thermophila SB210]|eukprot:XP_001023816.2 tetratricopeptide repeat protein [Tetrahymena thermophila SB210]
MYLFLQISVIFAFPTILMTIYGFTIILYYQQKTHVQVNDYAQSIYEQQISNSKILNNAIQFQLSQQVQRKSWSIQLMNQFSQKVIEGEVIMNKNYKSMFLNTERTYANKDEPKATYLFKKNKYGVVQVRTWHQYEYLYVNQYDQIGQDHLRNSTYSDLLWRLFEYDNILSSQSERYLKFNSIYHVFDHNSMGYLSATNTTFKNFRDPDGCPTGPNHFNGKCRYWYTGTVKQDSMILYPPDLFFSDQGNPFLASVLCQKLLRYNKTMHWVKCTSLNLQKMQSFFANMGNFSTYTMVIDPRNYSVIYHSIVPQQRAIANTLGSVELDNLEDQTQAQLFRDQMKKNFGNWVISEVDSVQADEILLPNYQKTFTYYRNGSEALAICNPVIIIDKIPKTNARVLQNQLNEQQQQIDDDENQLVNTHDYNNYSNINSNEQYMSDNILINLSNSNKSHINRNFINKQDRNLQNSNQFNKKQNQQKRIIQNNKKYRLEASFLLIDVLSQNDLKKFSIQMLSDTDYYSKISYITIFSILTILTLFILYQSICITHMIQFPIWHLTNFLKKINDSGDLNRFNTVNQAFSINVESFFYSEDMKILFISFKNMFQMLTFTNQSYFNSEMSATLLNYNKQIIHFEKFKNYRALGVCHNNIANILFYLERYIEALQHYESAIVYSKLELGLYKKDFVRDGEKPDDLRMFQSKQVSEVTNNQYRKQSEHQRIPSIFNRKSSTQAQTNPKSNQVSNQNGYINHDQFEREAKLQQSNYILNQSTGFHQNQTVFQNMQASVINKIENLNNISFVASSAYQLQNNLEAGKQANILKQKKKKLSQTPHNQNLINNDQNQQQQVHNKSQLQNNNNNVNLNNNDSHLQSNFNLVQNNEKQNKSEEKGSLSSEEEELQIVGYLLQQTREYHQLIFNLYHRKMNYLKCFINFLNSKQSFFQQFLWEEAEVLAQELISLAKYFPKKNGRNTIVYSYLSLIQTKQQKWKEAEESCLIAKEYVMKAYEYENHHQEIQYNDHTNKQYDELYTQIYQELSEDNLFNDQDIFNFFSELPSQTYTSKQVLDKSLRVNKATSLIQNNSNKNQNPVQSLQNNQKHIAKKLSLKETTNFQKNNEIRDFIQKQQFLNNQQNEGAFTDHKKRNSQTYVSNKMVPLQSVSIKQTEDITHLNERKISNKISQKDHIEALNTQHNTHNQSSSNNAKLISFLINQRILQYKNQQQLLQFLGSNQTNSQKQEIISQNQNLQIENHQNNINTSIYQSLNLQGQSNQENPRQFQLSSIKQQNNLLINFSNAQISPLQAKNYTSPQLNNNIIALKEKEQQNINQYYKSVNEVIQEEDQLHQDLQHTESQMSQELHQIKKMKQKQKNQQVQLPFKPDFQKPQTKMNQSFNQIEDSIENSLINSNHEIYKELNIILSNQQLFSAKKLNEDISYAYEPQSIKQNDVQALKQNEQQNNLVLLNELQNNIIWNEQQQNIPASNIQDSNYHNQSYQYQLQKTKKSQAFNRTFQNSNNNFNNNSVAQNTSKVKNQQNSKNLQNYEYPACVLHGIQINFNVAILLNQNKLLEAANKITDYIEQSLQYLPHYNFRILYQLQLIFQRFGKSSFQLNELLNVYKKQIYQRVGIIATCTLDKNKKNSYYFCKDLMKDILKHEEDTFGLLSYQDQLFNLKISNISYITLNKNIDILKKTLRQIFFSSNQETQEIKFHSQQQLIKPTRNNFIEKTSPFSAVIRKNTKIKNKSQSNATNLNEKSNTHHQELDDLTNQQLSLSNDTSFLSLDQSFSKNCNHQWQTLQNQNNNFNHHESINLSANNSPNITMFNTQPQQLQNKSQRSNTVGNVKKINNQIINHRSSLKQENKILMSSIKNPQNNIHDFAPQLVNADESRKTTTQASKRSIETQLFEKSLNPQEIFHIGIRKALTHFVPQQQLQNIQNQQYYQRIQTTNGKNKISESKQINPYNFSQQEKQKQSQSFQKVFQEATNIYIKEKNYKKYLIFLTDQYNVQKNQLYYQLCELLFQLDIQLLILQFNKDESIDEHSKSSEEFVENKCVIQYFYSSKKLLQYLYNQRSDYQSNLLPLAVEHFQTTFLFVFIF